MHRQKISEKSESRGSCKYHCICSNPLFDPKAQVQVGVGGGLLVQARLPLFGSRFDPEAIQPGECANVCASISALVQVHALIQKTVLSGDGIAPQNSSVRRRAWQLL